MIGKLFTVREEVKVETPPEEETLLEEDLPKS